MSVRRAEAAIAPSEPHLAAGVFGKVTARSDFWSSGTQGPAEHAFAGWLTCCVETSGGDVPAGAVRFVARCADGPTLVGSWIASRDAVGRSFPLSAWCRVPTDVEGAQQSLLLAHYEPFGAAAERVFSARLESDLDELEQARGSLVPPHPSTLPSLLEQLRGMLASVRVHAFAARHFERWPVEAFGYALATLQRAAELGAPDLTLDVPTSSVCDLFAWLELLSESGTEASSPSRILWSPTLRRMLVCLGRSPTQVLCYLNDPRHAGSRRWPLHTDTRQAALQARAELGADMLCCLDDNGTLSELISLSRSRL